MADTLNNSGRWLTEHLWSVSVELAILTALVVAALAVLRIKSPAVRHLFWCLVLIKPLTTILAASPVSFYGFLQLQPTPNVSLTVADDVAGDMRPFPAGKESMTERRAHVRRQVSIGPPPIGQEPTLDRYGIVAMGYLLAAAGLGLRLVLGCAYVSFLRHTARVQCDGALTELLARTANRLGVRRRTTLAVSNTAHSPVLAGILRPAILLPEQTVRALSRSQLEYILAHELTHLRRCDNLILLLQRLAELALFFHPAIWLCGWALRREAEAACDDVVLRRFDGPAGYADSLTSVAEMRNGLTRRLLVNTFAAAESNLAVRVHRILREPAGRMSLGLSIASAVAFSAIAGLGLPTAKARTVTQSPVVAAGVTARLGETAMTDQLKYGFRYNPMEFADTDGSLEGALVRTFVFHEPHPGDRQMIQDEIAAIKVFEAPDSDGDGCGLPAIPFKVNCENLLRAVQLGATEEHPEVRRALGLLDRLPDKPRQPLGGDALHALHLLGRADHPAVRHSLRWQIDHPDGLMDPYEGCPWTPSGALPGLWAVRDLEDVGPLVVQSLTVIRDRIEGTGCLAFNDPWSFVNCAAHIEHPIAREVLIRQIPMILRAQQPSGGWGENTFKVFAALRRHGLLDELRNKPPLPPDWRVVHSIPAPEGDLWGFLWDGERLWTGVRESNEALAISPDDGRLLNRVELPEGHGRWLGWWNGKLAVTQGSPSKKDPKRLLQIDPDDGRVLQDVSLDKLENVGGVVQLGNQLRVFDAFFGWVFVLDASKPRRPCQLDIHDPSPLPMTANAAGEETLWYVDGWAPWIVKCDHEGRLLDWSERPFAGYEGVAWDGEHLWAIDKTNQRICAIEKTDTAPRPSQVGR
ncbi:MAG: M56 family metallopeptidase [bacterium]|nr:M56 family metallopeptidase [bacterium]